MLTKFKKKFQSWMVTEAKLARGAGLTPNQVSAVGVLLALASGLSYWMSGVNLYVGNHELLLVLGSIFLLASGFCDALDGALARLHGKVTVLGGFLDSLLDRYADAAIYCGLMLGGLCDLSWGLIALVGSLLVSYTRARAEAAGVPMETVGLVERAERLLIIAAASFLNLLWADSLRWSVAALAVLTNLTVAQRVAYFRKKAASHKRDTS